MAGYYKDASEIEAVVKGFESCTTAKGDFSHQSHLTVAVFYLHGLNERESTERIRAGLLRFLEHHGVGMQKFHETLTVFWIKTVSEFLARLGTQPPLVDKTNAVIERFSDSRLVVDYYSEELLRSDEARKRWIEPDLKAL